MTDLSGGIEQKQLAGATLADTDPAETAEWLEALDGIVAHVGKDRAQYLLGRLADHAHASGLASAHSYVTPYVNTIALGEQPRYPGDLEIVRMSSGMSSSNASIRDGMSALPVIRLCWSVKAFSNAGIRLKPMLSEAR